MILVRGNWFFIVLMLLTYIFMSRPYLYVAQQDNYRVATVFKSKKLRLAFLIDLLTTVVFAAAFVGFSFVHSRAFWGFFVIMFYFIAEIVLYFVEEIPDKKKPMRYTRRVVRAMVLISLICTAVGTAALMHVNYAAEESYWRYVIFFLMPPLFPLQFVAVLSVINAFERLNNFRYERRAKAILLNPLLCKIGITGSYGKTSVKNYLAEMLSAKFRVLATPESYNTPMGIALTAAKLNDSHDVFIAEMGARRSGDIKKLMKIVNPQIGVLTGVNEQHIGTFKTFDNIKKEKLRVVTMLKGESEGFASDSTREFFEEYQENNLIRMPVFAGFDPYDDVYAGEIGATETGSVFNLYFRGVPYVAHTKLLGTHNVQNLTLAASVAFSLGITPEQITAKIAGIEPVPHRLHLISGNGIKIIDDTFNGNPDGARCALEVLSLFSGRKVVVTPGLVELGDREREENRRLGNELAKVASLVVLIGEARTEPISKGLSEAGYCGKTVTFSSLAEAQAAFKDMLHIGDVLLLLNDLPDIYSE